MSRPVEIFMGGARSGNWTRMTLTRSKKSITGSLSVDYFYGFIPSAPIIPQTSPGIEIIAYVGGTIAFIGTIDSRTDNITKDGFTVNISARGKTKHLINSSHQHKTTNMLQPTDQTAVNELIKPFGVITEWLGEINKLDKVRFRDGAPVFQELIRLATENAHFMYETRDGKLRITDDVGPGSGGPIILGHNILDVTATQSEANSKSEIKVKGQRTKKEMWGKEAINDTFEIIHDGTVKGYSPLIIQIYADATKEALKKRAKFEADKRSSEAKKITVNVFHVQDNGGPWDIGNMHYVQIPPSGIFAVMECTGLTYTCDHKLKCQTTITLSPPPSAGVTGDGGASVGALLGSSEITTLTYRIRSVLSIGKSFSRAKGLLDRIPTIADGDWPAKWIGPVLGVVDQSVSDTLTDEINSLLSTTQNSGKIQLTIPAYFDTDENI